MFHELLHEAGHALIDTLKTLPLLYLVYLLIILLQNRVDLGIIIGKEERRFGPIIGALLGSIPQCGFSAVCSELYGAGIIGAGTLISVFLSTSDEAIPVLLSHPGNLPEVILLLVVKILFAVLFGYLLAHTVFKKETEQLALNALYDEEEYAADEYERYLAEQDGADAEEETDEEGLLPDDEEIGQITCGCGNCSGNIFYASLYHTVRTGIFIAVTLFVIHIFLHMIGEVFLETLLLSGNVLQPFVTGLIGLIPGCAISVMFVELFLSGSITFGAAIAGLSTGAGFGYMMLFRSCEKKQCIKILVCTYLAASVSGLLVQFLIG